MPPANLKKKRKQWDKTAMINAVGVVRRKEISLNKAARCFGVPRATLMDYVRKTEKTPEEIVTTYLGRKPALTVELDNQLENYCMIMERQLLGLTIKDIKCMAFQFAIKNKLPHIFSTRKGLMGRKWLRNFLLKHPELSIRKPEDTSAVRNKGFTKENVFSFFDIYEKEFEKIKFKPSRLFNVDVIGITVEHRTSKVIFMKGKKAVASLSPAEKDALVTIVLCMGATGIFVPPLLVFSRKNMQIKLLDGAPPGTLAACHPNGWIKMDSFTLWFEHFISYVKSTPDDPVLLVLDGHYSHNRNLQVIDLARENGVCIMYLPAYCTHKMQPLDVAFMSSFKTYYSQVIESWLKISSNSDRGISHNQVAAFIGIAFKKSSTCLIAAKGFRKTGLYPANKHIFDEYDFAEELLPDDNVHSGSDLDIQLNTPCTTISTHSLIIEKQVDKQQKQCVVKRNKNSKKLDVEQLLAIASTDDEESNDDDALCLICEKLFSSDKYGEKWAQCIKCRKWYHENCAGDRDDWTLFICHTCLVE